ncbi:hypothetical protein [Mesonia aestuariivivens]|uniref:Uncharacterized protein n=1 Tax=Mesonia aestuariivivens TaxID=2796128 RepID=A0ABS6W3S5_9FLAO|nr:hypothetical protein [Mesonia aestuariivivens]MBW2962469.1 hypothetical protein [Mesonia aestuariivivens]
MIHYILKIVKTQILDLIRDFYTKMLSNKSRDESIRLVLEMVIELMPDGDNYKFQQIMTVLEDDFDSIHYPENLKKTLKKQVKEEK